MFSLSKGSRDGRPPIGSRFPPETKGWGAGSLPILLDPLVSTGADVTGEIPCGSHGPPRSESIDRLLRRGRPKTAPSRPIESSLIATVLSSIGLGSSSGQCSPRWRIRSNYADGSSSGRCRSIRFAMPIESKRRPPVQSKVTPRSSWIRIRTVRTVRPVRPSYPEIRTALPALRHRRSTSQSLRSTRTETGPYGG